MCIFTSLLPPANEVWGKVIFLHQFVILFTGGRAWLLRGGVHGCSGACVVARGACVIAPIGGMHGCLGAMHGCSGGMRGFICGGHAWFYSGACMVLFGGHAWFYSGGHAWFYSGGVRGFFQFFWIQ